uniref:Helicase n=1 Tax=viral metagenome TaxID=1070528 RepID=A0A6C0KTJ7_9ZZZZ
MAFKPKIVIDDANAKLLKDSQKEVIDEVFARQMKNGGLSLPLGMGKTRTGIILGLSLDKGMVLVVVSKTLLASWLDEIQKSFGDTLPFEVMHRSYQKSNYTTWIPKPSTKLVLTTPEVLTEGYDNYKLATRFIEHIVPPRFGPTIVHYHPPAAPMLLGEHSGVGRVFSTQWGCVLIDEIQRHTSVTTEKCRAISCLAAHHKWGLSGTMFDEPKSDRFLGFFVMLGIEGPRRLPDVPRFIDTFDGFRRYIVHRSENKEFVDRPEYQEIIVKHALEDSETKIFQTLKEVLNELNALVKQSKEAGDQVGLKKFSGYLMSMITYVRQALICPMIPIASMYCDMADFQVKSELSQIVTDKFRGLGLESYLQDERNILSSRFRAVLEKLSDHRAQKCIVFSSFRTTIELLAPFINETDRVTMTISSKMSIDKRRQVLKDFEESDNAVLLLPYDIGAEGLNLQCASVVMLMDLWWNSSKMEQAIGRIYRPGQRALHVFVYLFISNTGMEQKILAKNDIKSQILASLQNGPGIKMEVPRMTVKEIISIINLDDNEKSLKELRVKRKRVEVD